MVCVDTAGLRMSYKQYHMRIWITVLGKNYIHLGCNTLNWYDADYPLCYCCRARIPKAADYLECFKCEKTYHKYCENASTSTEFFKTFGCRKCTAQQEFQGKLATEFYFHMAKGKADRTSKGYVARLDLL